MLRAALAGVAIAVGLVGTVLGQESGSRLDLARRLDQLEADNARMQEEIRWLRDQSRQPQTSAMPVGMAMETAEVPAPAQPRMAAPAEPPVGRISNPAQPEPLVPAPPHPPAPLMAPAPSTETYTLDELRGEMKKLVWTKGDFQVVPYGILWGSATWQTSRTNPGDFTLFVLRPRPDDNAQTHVDCRSTRLGVDVSGPPIPLLGCAKSGGKVEIDFQRTLDIENRATLQLRHAYVEVKSDEFRLLAGQTSDVISPLYPGVLMFSVGWDGGNIGFRRAQIRGERYWDCSENVLVTAQGSMNADIVSDSTTGVTGDQSGWPVFEGRLATKLGPRGEGCLPWEFGVSSHIGESIYDIGAPYPVGIRALGLSRRTWSLNADLRIPITSRFGVQAEWFVGENLGAYFGGVGQGIDIGVAPNPITGSPGIVGTFQEIGSQGGWVDVWFDWTSRLHSHVGYSIDDPFDQDVTAGRVYNAFVFANVSFDVTPKFLVGLEFSSWKTLWVGPDQPANSQVFEFVAKHAF